MLSAFEDADGSAPLRERGREVLRPVDRIHDGDPTLRLLMPTDLILFPYERQIFEGAAEGGLQLLLEQPVRRSDRSAIVLHVHLSTQRVQDRKQLMQKSVGALQRGTGLSCAVLHPRQSMSAVRQGGDILRHMSSAPPPPPVPVSTVPSPTEKFIAEEIQPRRDEMNTVARTRKHVSILLEDARKRRRITPSKVGATHLLTHKGRVIGGIEEDENVTTLVSQQAQRVTQSLLATRKYLRVSDVPTAPAKVFHASQLNTAEKHWEAFGSAVTVRPASSRAHTATTVGITDPALFRSAWARAAEASADLRTLSQQIQVEVHRPALAVRFYLVGERAAAAVVRVPLYVVGDGRSTVGQLVGEERTRRQECKYLGSQFPAVDDEFLADSGLRLASVPRPGSIQMLTSSAAAPGGITVDVLNRVSSELIELATDAMWAFPGLDATAVDLLAPSLDSAEGAVVAGLDPSAHFAEFLYPTYGTPRRCGIAVLDHMLRAAF